MIKKFLILITVVFSSLSFAQQGSSSPYSFYGIGSLKFKGTVENQSMGGLSVYSDSIHINLRNPASYAGKNLKSFNNEARPIKYTVGGATQTSNLVAVLNLMKPIHHQLIIWPYPYRLGNLEQALVFCRFHLLAISCNLVAMMTLSTIDTVVKAV